MLDLVIGEGRTAGGAPVDEVLALVDEAALVEGHEDLAHGTGEALVHGEALAGPVAGAADPLELLRDDRMVLGLDLPCLLDELPAAELPAEYALLAELLLYDVLGGYARMVGAGHPEGRLAAHAVVADQDVLEGVVEAMAYVEDARDVGRGNDDDEGLLAGIARRLEQSLGLPGLIDAFLKARGVIGFGQLDRLHQGSLRWNWKARNRSIRSGAV